MLIAQVATATFTIVEIAKRAGVSSTYIPVIAIVVAVTISWLTSGGSIASSLFSGITAGASAMGIYSGAKATLK